MTTKTSVYFGPTFTGFWMGGWLAKLFSLRKTTATKTWAFTIEIITDFCKMDLLFANYVAQWRGHQTKTKTGKYKLKEWRVKTSRTCGSTRPWKSVTGMFAVTLRTAAAALSLTLALSPTRNVNTSCLRRANYFTRRKLHWNDEIRDVSEANRQFTDSFSASCLGNFLLSCKIKTRRLSHHHHD